MANKSKEIVVNTDVLVIGGGWAGFFAAIKAKEDGADVTLVDKGFASRSGASSMNDGHFTMFHEEYGAVLDVWKHQTAESGEYMNNPAWTEVSCLESWDRFQDILSWGIVPPKGNDGGLVHPFGEPKLPGGIDAIWLGWGSGTMPLVRKRAIELGINIVDRVQITDFIKQDGAVCGAVGFGTRTGDFHVFNAKATVLCTGTSSFKTQAPASCAGNSSFDGEVMVYRAGGEISGMEFSCMARWKPYVGEFPEGSPISPREGREIDDTYSRHVNWLIGPYSPILLLGNYIDADGQGVGSFHPYSLMAVHEGKGPMLQDVEFATQEEIDHAALLYPPDYDRFGAVGADPIGRALYSGSFDLPEAFAGRHIGGSGGLTSTDLFGGSSIPGLFGAGDAYHSGVCGSVYSGGGTGIRVATVSGARAGHTAADYAKKKKSVVPDGQEIARLHEYALSPIERKGGFSPAWVDEQVTNLIIPYQTFGVRSGDRLQATLTMLKFLEEHVSPLIYAKDPHELAASHRAKNRIMGAKMMIASALFREESRGLQYREDFPSRDDENWHCHVKIKQVDGKLTLSKMPIDDWWPGFKSKSYLEKYPKRYRGEKIPG